MEWYHYLLIIFCFCITSPIILVILYFLFNITKFVFYTMPIESFKLIYFYNSIKDDKKAEAIIRKSLEL